MKHSTKISALLSLMMAGLLAAPTRADESGLFKQSNILDLLLKQTGVYDRSKTGKSPDFVVDPAWPRPLPHNWLLGQIGVRPEPFKRTIGGTIWQLGHWESQNLDFHRMGDGFQIVEN